MGERVGHDRPSAVFSGPTSRRQVLAMLAGISLGGSFMACTSKPPAPLFNLAFIGCGIPIVATIEQIIGTNRNSCATPGAAVPHWAGMTDYHPPPYWNGTVPGDFRTNYGEIAHSDKNCRECPCRGVHGRGVFVQVNGVELSRPELADDGDTGFDIHTPGTGDTDYMHQMHCEISQSWKGADMLSESAMPTYDPAVMADSYAGKLVDVQGLVFADLSKVPNVGLCEGHSNSVWEIHPVTAWRPHV